MLVPDIVRVDFYAIPEERMEEILIFLMGTIAFAIFMKSEKQLVFHKKEKEKDQKKIDQAVKDLVESYSYIGEVNRKMDILMNIALGLTDQTTVSSSHEKETYQSIVSASIFLLKADSSVLRFVDMENSKTKKEFRSEQNGGKAVRNSDLSDMTEKLTIKKHEDCLIISSSQKIHQIKSYLIICGFDEKEESNPKNMEILKVFASQALFLYSYTHTKNNPDCPPK